MAYTARSEAEVKEYFDEPDELQNKIKKLAELVRKSKHLIAYTGAGISTACGIADYRSGINTVLETGAGKWAKEAAAEQGLIPKIAANGVGKKGKKKKRVSTFQAVPSLSHMALVALAKAGYLKHLISQNTDGLHRRSGFPIDQLSELHGNSTLEECPICSKVYMRDYRCRNKKVLPVGVLSKIKYIADQIQKGISDKSVYSPFITDDDKQLMATEISAAYIWVKKGYKLYSKANRQNLMNQINGNNPKNELTEKNKKYRADLLEKWEAVLNRAGFVLPRYLHHTGRYCAVKGCHGQLTDTIINFGESLPSKPLETGTSEASQSDLCLVLGSSCTVTPAANMPEEVGKKWRKETRQNADREPVHNLVICNIQKTPLHHLSSLPIHSKIDDVMVGLMKELKLEIPRWDLTRFIKVNVDDVGNREDHKRLSLSGIDVDGTTFTLFKSVVLRNNGNKIRKIINNKDGVEGEYNFIVPVWEKMDVLNGDDEEKKNDDDDGDIIKSKGLSVELEFLGNYEEQKLVIYLNEYLNEEYIENEGQIALKMIMNPSSKIWTVPNKTEQLKDKNVRSLWFVGKAKNDDHDQKNQSNDENEV